MTPLTHSKSHELTGRHAFGIFFGLFAIVSAVNGIFVYRALSTNTGVVAIEPYRKGLNYGERIAADERQHALGWRSQIALNADGSRITAALRTADGQPLTKLEVSANIGRPATVIEDETVTLLEISPGAYEAPLRAGKAGAYIADLTVRDPAGTTPVYRTRSRLWVRP
jgi:nitrogen fixation protein FixH